MARFQRATLIRPLCAAVHGTYILKIEISSTDLVYVEMDHRFPYELIASQPINCSTY